MSYHHLLSLLFFTCLHFLLFVGYLQSADRIKNKKTMEKRESLKNQFEVGGCLQFIFVCFLLHFPPSSETLPPSPPPWLPPENILIINIIIIATLSYHKHRHIIIITIVILIAYHHDHHDDRHNDHCRNNDCRGIISKSFWCSLNTVQAPQFIVIVSKIY